MQHNEHLILPSIKFYEQLGANYNLEIAGRVPYLEGIDDLIVNKLKPKSNHGAWLDVGCSSGVRLSNLITKSNWCGRLVGLDNCESSINEARLRSDPRKFDFRVVDIINPLTDVASSFDIVTCLWNVLGHIESPELRRSALINMRTALRAGGTLFIDCNNRLNLQQYGLMSFIKNGLVEACRLGSYQNFLMKRVINDATLATHVHLFSPTELIQQLVIAGFRELEIVYVNYETGRETTKYRGQIFVIAH